MKFYIKNMVCARCKMVVRAELEKAGMKPLSVELGETEVEGTPLSARVNELNKNLNALGFEIIDDRKSRMIEKVKNAIVTLIHHTDKYTSINMSDYISQQVNYDYTYLSNLFSEMEGTTIEKRLLK